jgi:chromosome segregation ATPase
MSGTTSAPAASPDTELALRRQLSRLQRQLAEAQRELANKEDELSTELEKRGQITAFHSELEAELKDARVAVEDLAAYRTRTAGIEQRLHERDAYVEELRTELEQERTQVAAAFVRVEELTAEVSAQRARWAEERAQLEADHAEHVKNIEAQKRGALDDADRAFEATVARMREGQDTELAHLRESCERQLQALRGELEPKALEARNLAEERERLNAAFEALRANHERELKEREDAHRRELVQTGLKFADEHTSIVRSHAVELARLAAERDAQTQALTDAVRNGEQRDQLWEQTVNALRETQKKLQLDLAESKETTAQVETDRASIEARLAMAARAAENLTEDNKALRDRGDAVLQELHRNALDRQRFVAYLEEGLAMLGALPERPEREDPEITVEAPAMTDEKS